MTAQPFLRAFQPTEPAAAALANEPPGMVHIGQRPAYWTGRMLIGSRHGMPADTAPRWLAWSAMRPPLSADALHLQALLLRIQQRQQQRERHMVLADRVITWGGLGVMVALLLALHFRWLP